ncbi:MAG: polyhydroxybutyrate depolymerase, partial [Actinomycetota bacterium]|nr:polyhydroxybutyrate depolymerase [Actinomycetota bacterium]
PTPSDCPAGADLKTGTSTFTLTSHGFAREYAVYAPASYTGRSRVPVVLEFHGFGSSAQQQMLYGNFGPASDRDGFLIAGPQGQGLPRHFTLLGPAGGEQDDVQFVADLLDHLQQTLCIDPARVYATGMSNGGALSAVLACRLSDRIAAFASVAAVVWGPQCEGARTVPIIAFHGTADPIVPFNGGRVSCCGNPTIAGAPDTMANWAKHDGCTAPMTEEPVKGTVTVRKWTACKPGGVVELYVVGGGGHTWPGAGGGGNFLGGTSKDVDASAVIWAFFKTKHL